MPPFVSNSNYQMEYAYIERTRIKPKATAPKPESTISSSRITTTKKNSKRMPQTSSNP
jgi:hypothetical protein